MLDSKDMSNHLMFCINEECGEVTQAIGKILRFGFDSTHPETQISNKNLLMNELIDLKAIIDEYLKGMDISEYGILNRCESKLDKINHYYNKFMEVQI